MRKKIVLITGANGAGKTTLMRAILKKHMSYIGNVYKTDRWPVIRVKGKLALVIGEYDNDRAITGLDLYRGDEVVKVIHTAMKHKSFPIIIMEAQKMGYGERLQFLKELDADLTYIVVTDDALDCWQRLCERGHYRIDLATLMGRISIMRYWHDTFPKDRRLIVRNRLNSKDIPNSVEKVMKLIFQ